MQYDPSSADVPWANAQLLVSLASLPRGTAIRAASSVGLRQQRETYRELVLKHASHQSTQPFYLRMTNAICQVVRLGCYASSPGGSSSRQSYDPMTMSFADGGQLH